MKFAIISDIHGNLPALSAVVNDALEQKVDSFIFAGDYIFDMPYTNEVVDLIRGLNVAVAVQGNKEVYLSRLVGDDIINLDIEQMGALFQAVKELRPDTLDYLVALKESCYMPLPFSGKAYVSHYAEKKAPTNKTVCSGASFRAQMETSPFTHEAFLKTMGASINEPDSWVKLSGIEANVIVSGHTHLQWYGYCDKTLIINPGSCGLPLDYDVRAPYTILEDSEKGLSVKERRIPYDIEAVINYSKNSKIYKKGRIWCELVYSALRTAKDEFSVFFKIAGDLADEKNESGDFFSNETWRQARETFFKTIDK